LCTPLGAACARCWESDDDMLALLLSELENPESRDVECDWVPSVLDSSPEYRCLFSKLGTVRMVEFMRFGIRGDKEGEDVGGTAFPLGVLAALRDMAALIVPLEAGVRVGRGEGCSCNDFGALLGGDRVGVAGGADSLGTTVTDEGSCESSVRFFSCLILDFTHMLPQSKAQTGVGTSQWGRSQREIAAIRTRNFPRHTQPLPFTGCSCPVSLS
jgi:hypothetical protein